MSSQPEHEKNYSPRAASEYTQQDGLFLDLAGGCVCLRWPRDIAKFSFGTAWIEMMQDEWVVNQGLMAVRLNPAGTHYIGNLPFADIGITPNYAEGLRPEAWVVREEDVSVIPLKAVERLLNSTLPNEPTLRGQLERLEEAVRLSLAESR